MSVRSKAQNLYQKPGVCLIHLIPTSGVSYVRFTDFYWYTNCLWLVVLGVRQFWFTNGAGYQFLCVSYCESHVGCACWWPHKSLNLQSRKSDRISVKRRASICITLSLCQLPNNCQWSNYTSNIMFIFRVVNNTIFVGTECDSDNKSSPNNHILLDICVQ